MVDLGDPAAVAFLIGRLLFGVTIAFMGLNHFLQTEGMSGYAEAKGLPAPTASVLLSGVVLVLGGLGLAAGTYPVIAAALVAAFLLIAAVTMHDFWAVPEEQQQTEMTQFLKNVMLAGGAITLGTIGTLDWPYSLGVGLF